MNIGLLETGSGNWNAIIWLIMFMVIGVVAIWIRSHGEAH